MPRKTLIVLAILSALAGCSTRHEAPACTGDAFALNPVEAPR